MRFSRLAGIDVAGAEWFDPVLTEDTPLYVDPFLVFEDQEEPFAGAHASVTAFFATASALDTRSSSRGSSGSPYWAKALRLLTFPEPKEFALGLSMGSPHGSGTGAELAVQMTEALDVMRAAVERGVDYVAVFALFVPGLGVDRISDMLCNILKSRFIDYTQQVCRQAGVAMEPVRHNNFPTVASRPAPDTADHRPCASTASQPHDQLRLRGIRSRSASTRSGQLVDLQGGVLLSSRHRAYPRRWARSSCHTQNA